MERDMYWLWFENIKGFGRVKKQLLLDQFDSPINIYHAIDGEVIGFINQHNVFNKGDIKSFIESKNDKKIKNDYRHIISMGINILTIEDTNYPRRLKNIYDPPNIIYYKGQLPKEESVSIGLVGARRCSLYGKTVTTKLSKLLSERGVNVVSGLARGIDTFAHYGALEGIGKTIAILGSGINVCYPKENEKLMNEIISKGCVMSEVPINAAPIAGNFPQRNRIISGLSDGVVIVEAAKKSGSLITADFALEQGKDVFAIPGRITDRQSEGTNSLIKMGAKPITCIEDILEEYNLSRVEKPPKEVALSQIEEQVFSVIMLDPLAIEQISKKTGIMIKDLQAILLRLELKGIICRLANNMVVRL